MEKRSFSINSSLPEINKVNDDFDALLSEHLSGKLNFECGKKFIEEFKVISYELFSNCIIHNDSPSLCFEIVLDNDVVELSLYSRGKGFGLKPLYNNKSSLVYSAPFPKHIHNQVITVYQGIESTVNCKILNQNTILFQLCKLKKGSLKTCSLPEHFGLYLITSLTDRFEYSRSDVGVDVFKISKLIK
ncbi:MAG: hypothetical protein WC644_08905 [Ignavibacteria bacterium]